MTDDHQDDIEPYAICDCGRVFNTQKEYEDHTEWCDEYQLKFFLAVHLLGAVPFFELNERYELAGSFLKKGHELFDELEIKYTK